jgi:acetyl esterase/lipase
MGVHPMPPLFKRSTQHRAAEHRVTTGAKPKSNWVFQPQQVVCLEERTLLSTFAASTSEAVSRSPRLNAGGAMSESASPWTELQNVSFPTVDGQSELLDVYTPLTPAPAGGYPVMVTIHGGGWRSSDKSAFGLRNANAFTQDGYVVVAPNYVLSAPGKPTWPLAFEDVQAAVRWVRTNAGTMDFNPSEIVGEGESAGANLAALLGVYSTQSSGNEVSSAVDAVVAVSTPTNLTTLFYAKHYAGGASAAQFLGGSPAQVPAKYIAASPIDHVSPGDPPMLLIQGRQDAVIPVSQSLQIQAALTSAGVPNQLLLVHGGHGLDFPTDYSNLVPDALEFLGATWKGS